MFIDQAIIYLKGMLCNKCILICSNVWLIYFYNVYLLFTIQVLYLISNYAMLNISICTQLQGW